MTAPICRYCGRRVAIADAGGPFGFEHKKCIARADVLRRYRFDPDGCMGEDDRGNYVRYEDAAALIREQAERIAIAAEDLRAARAARDGFEADAERAEAERDAAIKVVRKIVWAIERSGERTFTVDEALTACRAVLESERKHGDKHIGD